MYVHIIKLDYRSKCNHVLSFKLIYRFLTLAVSYVFAWQSLGGLAM